MNRKLRSPLAVALVVAVFSGLSCQARDAATAPAGVVALPAEALPLLLLKLPPDAVMTAGTTEHIAIVSRNLKPASCVITGPTWLGLAAGPDANADWTISPAESGHAELLSSCRDARNRSVTVSAALTVFNRPSVTPEISGLVVVNVGDSIDVSYDSSDTHTLDVACRNCAPYARMARVAPSTIRVFAQQVAHDTLTRGLCFTVHGMDGRFTEQQCVGVAVVSAQLLYSVPQAIRNSETVALHTIPVATYDNTGQSNHPDFLRVGASWSAGLCWMAYTPYAGSNGFVENPSLATSSDCEHWTPAAGVKAPLIDKPANAYNSDPELLYDKLRGCLGVVFRQVDKRNSVLISTTCDGKDFSAPRLLFDAPNHSAVSPTVTAGPDGLDKVWYVDAGQQGCSSQNNVVKMRTATAGGAALDDLGFGEEVATDLVQPGYVIWHIKVRYIHEKKEYWAMYAAFPMTTGIGNCSLDDLYLATSKDGVHWQTFPSPILNHLDQRFNFVALYRASFQYSPSTDNIRTIVSGIEAPGLGTKWGQYGVKHNYTKLMGALTTSLTVTQASLVASPSLVRKRDPRLAKIVIEDRR